MQPPTRKRSNKNKPFFKINLNSLDNNCWEGLDLSYQGLRHLSPDIFNHTFIKELHLEGNLFKELPKEISKIEKLEILNVSENKLWKLPTELCKCKNLRELYLSDNLLTSIPLELGSLYNIEHLDLDKNPLIEPFATVYKQRGGVGLLNFCRENNTTYKDSYERNWLTIKFNYEERELIKVGSYNILASRCSTPKHYPHAPPSILKAEYRFETIVSEIVAYNVDILCLQEVENVPYKSLFSPCLEAKCVYESIFYPKSRIRTINPAERGNVDGCATFWKKNLFQKKELRNLEFPKLIAEHPLFRGEEVLQARSAEKDNIATILLLEKINSDEVIVVNVHLHWNPEFKDIKLLQCIVLLEEIEKFKKKYPKAGVIICGDFNSLRESEVLSYIKNGTIDFNRFKIKHNLDLKDTHDNVSMEFTHYHPTFQGVIDYIFCDKKLGIEKVLLPPNKEYFDSILALPSVHFPSDHLFIGTEIFLKKNKN